jgi:hypothetical protein
MVLNVQPSRRNFHEMQLANSTARRHIEDLSADIEHGPLARL